MFLFVLIFFSSLCFGQASQTGTNRQKIKGQWVDTPVLRIKGGSPSYYDAHPEERAIDAAIEANKPLIDMERKLIEDSRTWEQGYGRGMSFDHPIPIREDDSTPSSPSPFSYPAISPGVINVRTGEYYFGVWGGVVNPKTGIFYPDVGPGYVNPKTREFLPKIGGK